MADAQQLVVLPERLDLFAPEMTQNTIESSYEEKYFPQGYQKGNVTDPLEFKIHGTDHFLDLEKSYFEIQGTFNGEDKDSTSVKAAASVKTSIVNNFFHSLFTSVKINVNGAPVSFTTENYPYIAYLHNLLNYPKDFQDACGDAFLWCKDTFRSMDDYSGSGANEGAKTRKKWIVTGDVISGIMKLRAPLFLLKHRYLLSHLDVEIVLNRTPSAFYMMGEVKSQITFVIDSMILRVRKVKPVPSYIGDMERFLRDKNEKLVYNLKDMHMYTKTWAGFGSTMIEDNIFHGILPERVVVFMVSNAAFNGKKDLNPFNFIHKNLTEISMTVNGVYYPGEAVTMDFQNKNYCRAYYMTLDSLQAAMPENSACVNISLNEFAHGFTLFSFDMSVDQYGSLDHRTLYNEPANVQLTMKFASAGNSMTDILSLCIYYETTSRMLVDYSRQVLVLNR